MEITAVVFQFLSRSNLQNLSLGTWNVSPAQRPDIQIRVDYHVNDKPFEINFAHVISRRPSIGACEYIEEDLDKYLSKRWPKCIRGDATIACPATDLNKRETLENILSFLRKHLWTWKEPHLCLVDQLATTVGYRREYFSSQLCDIEGNRRPSSSQRFVPTEIGEYVGPGVVSFTNINAFDGINEFVWSWIIPFSARTDIYIDFPKLKKKLGAIRKHFNSYDELDDSRRHLIAGEIKACIRAAASGVDAILRFYSNLWDINFPGGKTPFDEKIEIVLASAGKPSYRSADFNNSKRLLYLYRARNSMHEGDCCYKDSENQLIPVKDRSQAEVFVTAAEGFTLWIDGIV